MTLRVGWDYCPDGNRVDVCPMCWHVRNYRQVDPGRVIEPEPTEAKAKP
jgi:hypothetical protein